MKWNLYFLKNNSWLYIDEYHSGDCAKTNARHHQCGKRETLLYKIISPSGIVWRYGTSKITKRGFRMNWFLLHEKDARTVFQCVARGCPGCSVCNPQE